MDPLRGYRRLMRLLPETFRKEYGQEMLLVVREQRAEPERRGPIPVARFWLRQYAGLFLLALRLRTGWSPDLAGGGRGRRGSTTTKGEGMMTGLVQDARYALRGLLREPGFTLVTVLTLGLGIGASTTVFSAVHAVLFRSMAYQDVDRIVAIFQEDRQTGERSAGTAAPNVADVAEASRRLEAVAVAEPWSLDLAMEDRTETLRTWAVSEGFFRALETEMHLGRTFAPEEYVEGNEKVVLLGYRSWSGRFGADTTLVGRSLVFGEESYTVVGVLPPDFKYPDRAEAWAPRVPQPWDSRGADYMAGVGKLAAGVTVAEAQAEVDRIAAGLSESYPQTNANVGMRLVSFREHVVGDVRAPLLILLGAVGLVLLIACANVAGLMLARGARRGREYALRGALGAGRARLARHIALESLILAGVGCSLGVALTYLGIQSVQALGPDHLPRIDELRVDLSVLLFALGAAGTTALLAGLAPALKLSRPDLQAALSEGSRGATGGPGGQRLRNRLVILEVGAALVLMIGAGLLGKSFALLVDEELGFDPTNRLAVQVFAYDYENGELAPFVEGVLTEMEAIPGVTGVAITTSVPGAVSGSIDGIEIDLPVRVVGRAPPPAGQEPRAWVVWTAGGYFDLMDIPVLQGRAFDEDDRADAPLVVVVNEAFQRRQLGGSTAVGERIALPWGSGDGSWVEREIVGVVRDVRPYGFESEPRPEVYFPMSQGANPSFTFVLSADTPAEHLVQPAMEAVWAVNPSQSVWGGITLEGLLGERLRERRFNLLLLSAFAGIALLLSVVGIYGLISFSVEQRVSELGIRRALGGQRSDVLGMVIREGTVLAAGGVALGLVGAAALSRVLSGMLFGIEALDWSIFAGLAGAVLLVSALATLVPAWRATRIDPMEALRGS